MTRWRRFTTAAMLALVLTAPAEYRSVDASATGNDWRQYLAGTAHTGFTDETLLNPSNASSLAVQQGWPVAFNNGAVCPSSSDYCSSTIAAQPTVATVGGNRLLYVGTWNGEEYALCLVSCTVGSSIFSSGQIVWSTYVGRTSGCGGPYNSRITGVTGATAAGTAVINGLTTPVVYVGAGGDIAQDGSVIPNAQSTLFALDALTGAVVWQAPLGPAPSHYLWSSPLLAGGELYVGIASDDDCPLVQGGVVEVDPGTGRVLNTFSTVPTGCSGASVWSSPTADVSGDIYIATGNAGSCSQAEPYAVAVVKLTPDLAYVGSWQVPATKQVLDGDFGSTPTLFAGTVSATGKLRALLGVANKNGLYYVFDTANLAAGPVKKLRIAASGSDPEKGGGSISPSSYDGTYIYVAGGTTTINSVKYSGSLRAFNPNRLGAGPVWQLGLTGGPVLAAVITDPGLAVVSQGAFCNVVDSATGAVQFTGVASGFYGAPIIAYGVIYEGDTSQIGQLHAYSVKGQ